MHGDGQWSDVNITAKELLPIVLDCAMWGKSWHLRSVLARCDNMAVVAKWAAQSSKHQLIMHLMRCLHFVCAFFKLELQIEHIKGSDNVIADAVSCNLIHKVTPEMDRQPTEIPHPCGNYW